MGVNVSTLVVDPDFLKMSPADQQSTLAQVDPDFGKLDSAHFANTVWGLQHNALAGSHPSGAKAPHQPMTYAPMIGPVPTQPDNAFYPDQNTGKPTTPVNNDPSNNEGAMPGVSDGANLAEGLSEWDKASAGNIAQGVNDVAHGDLAKGGHEVLSGAMNTMAPAAPFVAAAAPVAFAGGTGGGMVGQKVGQVLGKHLGLNDDQTNLLSDLFAIAGGYAGAKGVPAIVNKAAGVTPPREFAMNQGGDKFYTKYNDPELGTGSPIENQVISASKKVNLPDGLPEDTIPDVGEDIQPQLHSGIRQIAADAAKDAGVDYTDPASIRDAVGTTARGVVKNAQGDFQALDEASGGRWQRFTDQIKNIQQKMDEVNGIDDTAYDNLQTKRNDIETSQAQMIEDMKEAGKVDPDIADRAVAQYRKGMALQDLNNAVKASTKRVPVDGEVQEIVDPNSLANRLSKLNDTPPNGGDSRLVQALGEDGAGKLTEHVDNAQIATQGIKEFQPVGATGRYAYEDLLRNNTMPKTTLIGGKPTAKINWIGVQKDFEAMTPEQRINAFGDGINQLRKVINTNVRWQVGTGILKKVLPYGAAFGAGDVVVKKLLE